jgi:hypothetical protein
MRKRILRENQNNLAYFSSFNEFIKRGIRLHIKNKNTVKQFIKL